jgi:hypothetical protein
MNHYINLLEPSECHYVSSTEKAPLIKAGAALVAVSLIAWMFFTYRGLQSTIQEGEVISDWFKKNEEKVADAEKRLTIQSRISKARRSLEGWGQSRYDFPELLTAMAQAIPAPQDQIQFTMLYFNEELLGAAVERLRPGSGETAFYPMERQINLELRGRVRSERPDLMLDDFRARLADLQGSLPLKQITLRLEDRMTLKSEDGEMEVTPFAAELVLKPRKVLP